MEMEAGLTWGAVVAIWEGDAAAAGMQLVLQVYDVDPCAPGLSPILLSDGEYVTLGGLEPSIISSTAFRAGRLRRGAVVRLLDFMRQTMWGERVIVVKELEVLRTKCMIVGNPKLYSVGNLEDKHEELDAESVASSAKLNCVAAYSAGQGLKGHLTRGVVAVLQQPVMQVLTVSLTTRSELKNIGTYNLVLSDGVHTQDAALASQLDHLVKNTRLRRGAIVRLLEFMCNTVQSPSLIVITQLEVLQTECELIGSPKSYKLCCTEKPYALEGKCGEPYPRSVANYSQPMNGPYLNDQGFKGHLTGGAVVAILEGEMTVEQQPVMQVVDVRLLDKDKFNWRGILLSDGVYQMHGVLLSHLRHLVDDNCLRKGTIVRVLKFVFKSFQRGKCIFVMGLEVLQMECEVIGSPTFYKLGNKQELGADHAAYVPADDAAQSTGRSHPRYKATPG